MTGPTSSESRASAIETLREVTNSSHRRLHAHPLLRDLTTDRITLADYRRIIAAFYGFYRRTEPALTEAARRLGCPGRYGHKVRTEWLIQDLRDLGFSYDAIESLPGCGELTALSTRAELAGCLYVIEGSTLGGLTIVRSLAGSLRLDSRNGARFFFGHGDETTPGWRRLCGFIEATCQSDSERARATETAQRVFSTLEDWLTFSIGSPRVM